MAVIAPPSPTGSPRAARPLRMTPGRRAALLIGVPLCLLGIASTGLNLVSELGIGKYPVHYTAPASARAFDVSVGGGGLTVKPGAAGQRAVLAASAEYSLIRSTFTGSTDGDIAKTGYHCPMPVGECSLDGTLTLPPTMALDASTGGGDLTVTGLASPVSLNSGGGDLSLNGTSGRLTLSTGGGDINGNSLKSPTVKVATGGGDVELIFSVVPQNVQVNTGGGDITIVLPDGTDSYAISTSTGGGDVNDGGVTNDPASGHVITTHTGGGNITIRQQ
jgi:Putative adhesin